MIKLTPDQERKLHDLKVFAAEQIDEIQKPRKQRGIGYLMYRVLPAARRTYRDVQVSRIQRLVLMRAILSVTNDDDAHVTRHLGQPVSPQGH